MKHQSEFGRLLERFGVIAAAVGALSIFAGASGAQAAGLLDEIKARDFVHCGTAPNVPGYAFTDANGDRVGFDIDLCHALAAAILGDPDKVKLSKMRPKDGFPALQTGQVDILTHRLTWTFNRDNGTGMNYTRVMIYDGQGFIVRKDLGVSSISELDGAAICVAQGTTVELNVADFFRTNNLSYNIVSFGSQEEAQIAYDEERCDAFSTDRMGLAARSLGFKNRADHVILPETISKEPIGPLVAHNQDEWADTARWVFNALIAAEELGVTQGNIDDMRANSQNPEVQRLIGVTGDFGQRLELSNDWAYNAIKAVGNYGEIYDRHLGPDTRLGLERGRNALWTDGGLIIAPPFR